MRPRRYCVVGDIGNLGDRSPSRWFVVRWTAERDRTLVCIVADRASSRDRYRVPPCRNPARDSVQYFASSFFVLPVTVALMFPPLANGAGAIRRMPLQLRELLRIWGAPSLWKIRRVYLPLAIPDILTGVRASSTWAVGATLIAEGLLNGVSGDSNTLGHYLVRPFSSSASPGRTPAVILIATVLGFLVYLLFVGVQRYWESRLIGDTNPVEISLPLQARNGLRGRDEGEVI